MTPAEYLEHVQEALAFPASGVGSDPAYILYATDDQCRLLRMAHENYVKTVALILNVDLPVVEPYSPAPA
jgi:hypothetical protein